MKKSSIIMFAIMLLAFSNFSDLFAGCRPFYESETIANAKKAIESNDVSQALKLVKPVDKKLITDAFNLAMKVRVLNSDSKELADKYFLEILDRVHQSYDRSFPWMMSGLFYVTTILFLVLYIRKK